MSLAESVRLAEGQVAASGAVLARAFADDPLFTYSLADPVERERLMPPLMTAWTRYGLLFGVVDVTAGPVEASAIWLPPDAVVRTPERRERAGVSTRLATARARAWTSWSTAWTRPARPPSPFRTGISSSSAWTPRGRASAWEACCCARGCRASTRTGSSAGWSPGGRGTCRSTSGTASRSPSRGTAPTGGRISGSCDGDPTPSRHSRHVRRPPEAVRRAACHTAHNRLGSGRC
jgi:hypothetical protein